MEILQKEVEESGMFYVEKDHEKLALMTYSWYGEDRIVIEHTEVSDELKGLGIGKQLVGAAVNFAREKKIKIVPLCPFAKSVLHKVTEFQDVL